jgi:hypothetical protein
VRRLATRYVRGKVTFGSTDVASPTGSDAVVKVPVYVMESGTALDEKLATWQLTTTLQGANVGPSGVHLGTATPSSGAHPYVFGSPTANFSDLGSDASNARFLDFLPGSGTPVNITNGMGLLEIPVIIPAGTQPGTYTLTFNPDESLLASADETTFPGGLIPATFTPGTVTVTAVPEPISLGLLGGIATLGVVRRRRVA